MRRVTAVVVVAIWAVAASCSGGGGADGDSSDTAADPVPGLEATLQRSTLFDTRRSLLLDVRYDGDDELAMGAIQLSSPLFEPVPPEVRDATVPGSGRPVAMPLPYGAAVCDDVADAEADAQTELVTDVDGEEVRLAVEASPDDMLLALHDAECAVTAVLTDVELRLGDTWERTAPRAIEGRLEVTQLSPGTTAAVTDVLGNVIFAVATEERDEAADALAEVGDDQPSATVPVTVTAARCDPHALTEYKRTFILVAWVAVDGDEPVRVDVEAEGDAHRALEELLAACLE